MPIIEILIIPLAIALVPLIWQASAASWRRSQFTTLILREVEELGPYPKEAREWKKLDTFQEREDAWKSHVSKKRLIHREILDNPTENRDFILSLDASFTYFVYQLWHFLDPKEDKEATSMTTETPAWKELEASANQILYFLKEIERCISLIAGERRRKLAQVRVEWFLLFCEYQIFENPIKKQEKLRIFIPQTYQERWNEVEKAPSKPN